MELVLVAAVVGLAISLVLVARRARDADRALRAVAARLGSGTRRGEGIVEAADRVEARAAAAEAQLDRVRADLATVAGLVPTGIVRLGEDGRVDLANDAAHAMLDASPGRLVGRTVMEAFLDADVERLVDASRAGGGAAVTGELARGPRGARRLAARVQPSPTGTWILLEDVTELLRLRQIRTEFIDNLSHELRTPLSTLSLLAETLSREAGAADLPGKMRDRIARIELESGHLVQMVNELLDLSRIESGAALELRDDVDLAALATSSAERLRLFAERQGVALRVEADAAVPRVRGDEARLGQVIVNLVHNAVKFSHAGGSVDVGVRTEGSSVVVAVADTGIGIPRADRARIFERFYKVDRARVRGGGTGLGLSIARHVVEGHGGRIWVESEEGTGSTFRFAIPVAGADVDETGAPGATATEPTAARGGASG